MASKSNIIQNVPVVLLLVLLTMMAELVAPAVLDADPGAEYCPKMCSCDILDGLKRADCSNEHLISTHTGIPSGVEILDLSLNMVSSIEDDNLATYDNLVKLFLSENSIETISLNAFAGLTRLKTLDLSHNRLEQLDGQLFERNGQLVELNLAHNNFMTLSNRPFLTSSSIRMLDLSGCRIPQIFDATFSELPNLRTLDLSKNVMISLSPVPFAQLRSLSSIELTDNRWNCGSKSVRNTIRSLKKQIATIHVENCLLTDRDSWGNEFERMLENPTGKNDRVEVPIEEVWGNGTGRKRHSTRVVWPKFMNYTCSFRENDPASQESCDQFVECQLSFGELYNQLLSRRNAIHGGRARQMIFFAGVVVGMLIGSFGTYIIYWAVRSCRKRRSNPQQTAASDERKQFHQELRREFQARNRFAHSRLKESPTAERHGRTRRGSLDEEIYQNHEHTRQFLVNLFSKRQPRYLRNNSQIANINNRHVPPAATREPRDPPALQPSGNRAGDRAWNEQNSENFERERMLIQTSAIENLSQPTWVSIRPTTTTTSGGGTLPRNSRPAQELPTTSETPPPPYAEFALNIEPKEEPNGTREY